MSIRSGGTTRFPGPSPLVIDIDYDLEHAENTVIKTNIKSESLKDVLDDYLRAQMGLGADLTPPAQLHKYRITIELDLRDDSFTTTSNTKNAGLTAGIVAQVSRTLSQLKIEPLREVLDPVYAERLPVQTHRGDLEDTTD